MDRWDKLKLSEDTQRPTLLENETELLIVPKVGIYDGEHQVARYQDGLLTITNHRLLWKDSSKPLDNSIYLSLSLISRFTARAGFVTSSPKVVLFLLPKTRQSPSHPQIPIDRTEDAIAVSQSSKWTCTICSETNPIEMLKCSTCGVPNSNDKGETFEKLGWNCHVCTFINEANSRVCEMCGTPKRPPPNISPTVGSDVVEVETDDTYIKLSFRGRGGSSNFVAHLQMALQKQDWKVFERTEDRRFDPLVAGVSGLLKKVDIERKMANESLNVAFNDLDALMDKASEMVRLAETISSKLMSKSESTHNDDNLEDDFRKMLLEMGISSVVTREMAGTVFNMELARQLSEFVMKLLERRKAPLVSLADIYCVYNRARGSSLISPNDLYQAALICDQLALPITLKKLPSGLLVFQTRALGDEIFSQTIRSLLLNENDNFDALELARLENVSLSITLMYLCKAELEGIVCRDQSPTGIIRYYRNMFLEF